MTTVVLAFSCPRCAAGAAARRAFWENAPFEQLTIALVPFLVVALTSFAVARYRSSAERP
jgi:hypothetical protein